MCGARRGGVHAAARQPWPVSNNNKSSPIVCSGAKVYFLNGTSTFNGECLTPACFCYRSRGHAAGEPLHRIVAALPGCARGR